MAKTITISAVATNPNPGYAPEALQLLGTLPAGSVEAADIVDSTTVGRAVLTAASAAAGRTAIGAGVPLVAGTAVADVTPAIDGTAVGTAFNALLASLRANGVLAP